MARVSKMPRYFNPLKSFYALDYARFPRLYDASSTVEAWYEFYSSGLQNDSSPNARNGTASNVTSSTSSPYFLPTGTNFPQTSAVFGAGTNGKIDFSTSFSSTYSKRKLSFSFWINLNNASTSGTVFTLGATKGILISYFGGNKLQFSDRAFSVGSGTDCFWTIPLANDWHHVLITYDRTNVATFPELWLDGVQKSRLNTNTSAGTVQNFSGNSYMGDATTSLFGSLDSFVMWSSVLTSEQVAAIYYSKNGTFLSATEASAFKMSGILSLPARVELQQRDNKTGSYPTIARTGDPDFTGKYPSFFDDTNTVNFLADSQIVYPTALPASSKWINEGIAAPNILQGLTTFGMSSKGVADAHVSFTPGQDISPFDESRIYIDNDSSFYEFGVGSSVLPGFNQRLASKTQIKLNFSNNAETSVLYTTGSFYRFLNNPFTVNGYSYSSDSHLLQQWRLDTPQRSGSLSDQSGNSAYPSTSGSSYGGSWAQSISSLIPGWQTSVSHQRPVVEEFSNRLTDFYAASTAYSGSDFGSLQDGAGAAGGSFNWNGNGISGSGGLSISFWVKFDFIDSFRNTAGPASLVNCSNLWSISSESYEVGIDKNGAIRLRSFTNAPGVRDFKTQDGFIAEGKWYFLSVTYDETASPKVAIFKNGTAATITTIDAGTGNDKFGAFTGNAFVVLGHATTTYSEILSSSVGQWCDLSIHARKISENDHRAMYYAPWFPTVDSNTGLAYFNFSNSGWNIIGASGSIDYTNPLPEIASSSYLAFTPKYCGGTIGIANDVRDPKLISRTIGVPTDLCGFPHSSKFNPTNSQLFSLSNSLTGPFLVEKIVYTFSASLPPTVTRTSGIAGDGPECAQVFLLKSSNENYASAQVPLSVQILSGGNSVPGIGGDASKNQASFSFYPDVTKNNFLIDVGTISRASSFIEGYYRDLNLGSSAVTGTIRVESSAKVFGASGFTALKANRFMGAAGYNPTVVPHVRNVGRMGYTPGNQVGILRNQFGGRDGLGIATSEGRSFVASVVGSQISGSLSLNYLPFVGSTSAEKTTILTNRTYNYPAQVYASVTSSSPIVLFPNDKIAIGFSYNPIQPMESYGYSLGKESEQELARSYNGAKLLPGSVEITLFGSLLQNNLPVNPESNQPLTSDAVHEDIHYDNPVFDQFDVEPFASLSGSYVDYIITGSMFAAPISDPNSAVNVRKVQASIAAGQAGSTGSIQRFIRMQSEKDLYYDASVPEFSSFLSLLGATAEDFSTFASPPYGKFVLNIGIPGNVTTPSNKIDFARSFPFSGKLINVKRSLTPASIFSSNISNGRGAIGNLSAVAFVFADPADTLKDINYIFGATNKDRSQSYQNALKSLFAYSRNKVSGCFVPEDPGGNAVDGGYTTNDIQIRGYKYGLSGLYNNFSTLCFRRDRYGQFRDMLEQAPNAAYLVDSSVEYPLEIKFRSRSNKDGKGNLSTDPYQTHSQNVSPYSTSSLPYFDGVARDRTDDPDVTVEPLQLI